MTGYVTDLIAKMTETVSALTGADMNKLIRRLADGSDQGAAEKE